jgi:hypothetical protein
MSSMMIRKTWFGVMGSLVLLAAIGCGDDNKGSTTGTGGTTSGTGGAGGRGGSGGSPSGSGGSGGVSVGSGGTGGGANLDAADAGDGGGDVPAGETGDVASEVAGPDVVTPTDAGTASAMMSFFVTSETTTTPNLGGIGMADAKCQRLGTAAGSTKTWKAYLSTATENARTRIGAGPWHNFKGELIASNLVQLHEEGGMKNKITQDTGLTDKGQIVSGKDVRLQGESNQHDILTGSLADGMVAPDLHCDGWTATTGMKQVGHLDRTGTNPDPIKNVSWNSSHATTCANTSAGGGAGRFYCFATN